jgi:hypothetical protein
MRWVNSGDRTASIAERLSAAIEPSLRTHFLEAMNNVVQEFNLQDSVALTLNLEGDQIRMNRVVANEGNVATPTPSDYSARIALRLSDGLKEDIEHLATDVGSSVNSWIVRTLERSVRSDPTETGLEQPAPTSRQGPRLIEDREGEHHVRQRNIRQVVEFRGGEEAMTSKNRTP